MLEIQHLRYQYRAGINVLDDVSLSLDKGEILCLLGPNGTGKTTLLRCLLGFNRAQGGDILLDGRSLLRIPQHTRAKLTAYVPQSTTLAFSYEAREVVLMGRVAHLTPGASHTAEDKRIAMQMLEALQIEHLATRRFQELSGGERQMVLIARALAQQADYLVMDEPTANLDYSNQVKILKVIRDLAKQGYGIDDLPLSRPRLFGVQQNRAHARWPRAVRGGAGQNGNHRGPDRVISDVRVRQSGAC